MWILIATTVGAVALVVTWSLGLPADVGGLIALGFLSLGILGQMAERASERRRGAGGAR
jgi:hypothetical protein